MLKLLSPKQGSVQSIRVADILPRIGRATKKKHFLG